MNRALSVFGGIGLGAGLMYFFDPEQGRRRRCLVRDQLFRAGRDLEDGLGVAGRDLSHRLYGLLAEGKTLLTEWEVSDEKLQERIRAQLGRVVSHPSAIEVAVHDGRVTLSGPILANEVECLFDCVASMFGVKHVENRMEVHQEPGDVPGLQGGTRKTGPRTPFRQEIWSPAARGLAGMVGTGLVFFGLTKKAPEACILGTAGIALALRGLSNVSLTRLAGMDKMQNRSNTQPTKASGEMTGERRETNAPRIAEPIGT